MYFKNKNSIKNKLKEANLDKIWPYIEKEIKPSIEIDYTPCEDNKIKLGKSKIGGEPDLPENITWPTFRTYPQSFITQINIKDLKKFDVEKLLPSNGVLLFFYDCIQLEEYGKGGTVIFCSDEKELKRRSPPENVAIIKEPQYSPRLVYDSATISFFKGETIPYSDHIFIKSLCDKGLIDKNDLFEKYYNIVLDSEDGAFFSSRLFGHSENCQQQMESNCYIYDKGLKRHSDLTEKQKEEINISWRDWILLLQIDCIPEFGMYFHWNGTLYYWIKKIDLIEKRFDRVIVIMQD